MENVELLQTVDYIVILNQINENVEKLYQIFEYFNIALFLIVFSLAIIVSYCLFGD